jgi:hypothetical protein
MLIWRRTPDGSTGSFVFGTKEEFDKVFEKVEPGTTVKDLIDALASGDAPREKGEVE